MFIASTLWNFALQFNCAVAAGSAEMREKAKRRSARR
jgi:hypothetical protein